MAKIYQVESLIMDTGIVYALADRKDKYHDANIGFVDASVVAIAERLKVCGILTTDRRHFSTIKPQHCKEFTLLP